jgi:hypothetical protein
MTRVKALQFIAVLELSASVVDADGKAVGDLREPDFEVRVGGRERKVLVARFRAPPSPVPTAPPDAAPAPPSFTTNAAGLLLIPGRSVDLTRDHRDPAEFGTLAADVDLTHGGAAIKSVAATVSASGQPTRRVVEAELATDGLAPGVYTLRARIRRATGELLTVSRDILLAAAR